jgi:ATP/maltotriose-dependent transcriptional regulator MalT
VTAQCKLVQGDVTGAVRWAQQGVTVARELSRYYYPRALQHLVEAWAMAGQPEEAAGVLEELESALVDLADWEAGEVERARGWVAVARRDLGDAVRRFTQSAAMAARSGDRVVESAALHDLARLGRAADVSARLAELAAVIEGPLAPARAAHAAALAANDPVALERASAAFEAMGAIIFAAEAMTEAAVAWRRSGAPRKAVSAEQRAAVLAARCDGARTPGLATAAATRAVLSARELEIAGLAARGIANKDIAAQLCLSLHTVENRLHAVYEKLGVSGRAELRQVLDPH